MVFVFLYNDEWRGVFLKGSTDCVSECVREVYSVSSSSADYDLGNDFRFGNWSISPNERLLNYLSAIVELFIVT